jgi:Bacterial toxin homologue of phage lysozyme, C-term
MLEPKEGLLTFRAEGNNVRGSLYYSRKIHWPGIMAICSVSSSGVTIGRGFDLGKRNKGAVLGDLLRSGLDRNQAEKIVNGTGKTHCNAGEFVRDNRDKIGEITERQQLRLFEIAYNEIKTDTVRLYDKYRGQGSVSWDKLNPVLKDVMIDLRYQGLLFAARIKFFEKNDHNEVINLIKKSPDIYGYEKMRGRVKYILDNYK